MTASATPRHLARTAFVVKCGDGQQRHSGHWTDAARAQHWATQAPAAGCCNGAHQVVRVAPRQALRRGGWT